MTDARPPAAAGRGRLAQVLSRAAGKRRPRRRSSSSIEKPSSTCSARPPSSSTGSCASTFAAFSLTQREHAGLTPAGLEAVTRWRRHVAHTATEEMLRLALVHNLLSAIGAAPDLSRPTPRRRRITAPPA